MHRKAFLFLVVAIFLSSAAIAQDVGWPPAPVEKTGQVSCFNDVGDTVPCGNSGQDGDHQAGIPLPTPRFHINGDGTVTDYLTGLIWLRDADCLGDRDWEDALTYANGLYDGCAACGGVSGDCGLSDGSAAGDWRLPNLKELQSLVHHEYYFPAIPNTAGTSKWTAGDPFSDLQIPGIYWTSTSLSDPVHSANAFYWAPLYGITGAEEKTTALYVWAVKSGPALYADGFGPGDTRQWSE